MKAYIKQGRKIGDNKYLVLYTFVNHDGAQASQLWIDPENGRRFGQEVNTDFGLELAPEEYEKNIPAEILAWARQIEEQSKYNWEEVSIEKYNDMLGAVPPVHMCAYAFMVGEPLDSVGDRQTFDAYIQVNDRAFHSVRCTWEPNVWKDQVISQYEYELNKKPSDPNDIWDIKKLTFEKSPHFFDTDTLRWFGQTMNSFRVKKSPAGRIFIYAPSRQHREFMGFTFREFKDNDLVDVRHDNGEPFEHGSWAYGRERTQSEVRKSIEKFIKAH